MGLVILIGMMGSGKSTVGMELARLLDVDFFDTDKLLEQRLGRPIRQWFQIYGEQAFREHETLMLKSLDAESGVLATGGGIILRDENWSELKRLGTTVFLDVDPEVLKRRLTQSKRKRPLLEVDNWEEKFDSILNSRRDVYNRADQTIEVGDEALVDVAQKIKNLLHEYP
ncbi:MAG: shikimate kinase [Chthonomonadaceae bacterium]|nr:shikimate kinase [Chthonomonadaceae bacterium]